MIKSYRIFISKDFIKKYALFSIVIFAVTIAAGITGKYTSVVWLKGITEGLMPMLCTLLFPVCSLVSMAQIYNANMPDQPNGYKYFHSLKNSAGHFKQAIVFGNLISLMLIIPTGAALMLLFPTAKILLLMFFTIFSLGFMNFFGHMKSIIARLMPLAALGGSIGAFWAASEDMDTELPYLPLVIIGITAVLVYAGGIIYSVARAKSAWNKELTAKEKKEMTASEAAEDNAAKKISKAKRHGAASFLVNSVMHFPKTVVALIIFALITALLPFLVHEPIGEDDYLMPKVFIFFPAVFLLEMILILFSRNIAGNKMVRSMPIAKKLYTRSLPGAIPLITFGVSGLAMGAYFIFLGVINAEVSQFSDTLVTGSIICASTLFFAPFVADLVVGGLIMIYAAGLPFIAVMLLMDKTAKTHGYGVPLYLAVTLFALTAVLGTLWCFYICSHKYRKKDLVIYPQQALGK